MKENIVQRIIELCKNKQITIAYLERKANLGNGTIKRWNTSSPSIDKVFKIANMLDVSVDYLYRGKENKRLVIGSKDITNLTKEELRTINDIIDFYNYRRNNK